MSSSNAYQFPRALNDWERSLLMLLIGTDEPGSDALRVQAPSAVAIDMCPCGCGTIDLAVDKSSPPAWVDSPFPVEAMIERANGTYVGAMLFIGDTGHMASLELVWYGEQESLLAERPLFEDRHLGRWTNGRFKPFAEDGLENDRY
jgi:hypothetical protein